jgi:HEAT repeat protein
MLLTDYIDKEMLRTVLIFLIFSFGLITITNFVVLFFHKIYIEKREKRIKQLEGNFLNKVMKGFSENKIPLIRLKSSLEIEAFSNVLSSLAVNLSGDFSDFIKEIAEKSGLISFLKKKCNSKNWLTRLEALERLGFLKISELKRFYLSLLEKERESYVKLQILLNLSWIADNECLEAITNTLNNISSLSLKFSEYLFTNVIHSMKDKCQQYDFVQFLNKAILDEKIVSGVKKSIIEACGVAKFHEAKDLLLSHYDSMDDDLKISCVRSLGRMLASEVCETIKKAYLSDNWILKVTSLQYIHICDIHDKIKILTDALQDYNFYVRKSAALSLCQLGNESKEVLWKLIENIRDNYARDTAIYILKRVCRNA